MLEVVVGILHQSAVHCVGYAVCDRCFESHFDVKFIILLKEAIGNDVEELLSVVSPILRSETLCDVLKLRFKQTVCFHAEGALHGIHDIRTILSCDLPRFQFRRRTASAGVSHIEHITQIGLISVSNEQSNTGRTSSDISAIFLIVPFFIGLTEGSTRTLGIDHHLFGIGELIVSSHCGQKRSPVILIGCDPVDGFFCHPRIKSLFSVHFLPPILKNQDKGSAFQKSHRPYRTVFGEQNQPENEAPLHPRQAAPSSV